MIKCTKTGDQISSMNCHKINTMTSNKSRVVVGDDKGRVLVWDKAMVNRKLQQSSIDGGDDENYQQTMRDKLEALKNR